MLTNLLVGSLFGAGLLYFFERDIHHKVVENYNASTVNVGGVDLRASQMQVLWAGSPRYWLKGSEKSPVPGAVILKHGKDYYCYCCQVARGEIVASDFSVISLAEARGFVGVLKKTLVTHDHIGLEG